MPRLEPLRISSTIDPDIATVANRAEKYISLAVDKAIASTIDPVRFPISTGTLEHLLLQRLKWIPTANQNKGEKLRDLVKERARRLAKAQQEWRERYTDTGRLRPANRKTWSYLGPLAGTVRLESGKPIAEQLPPNYFFGNSPRLMGRMKHLVVPVNNAVPASKAAYEWWRNLVGAGYGPSSPAPARTTLECLIREVKCIDETDGFCWTETGSDEIKLGGMKVDPCAIVTKIKAFKVKGFAQDGDTKTYPPPDYKLFTDFSLQDQGDWPRTFFATFVLGETDMGGLGEFLIALVDLVRLRLAAELATALGPTAAAALLPLVPGVVAAAIAIALMVIVFVVVIAVFAAIKKVWEDDVFEPVTVMMPIDSLAAANGLDWVSENLWGAMNFAGHGGHYQLFYSWRCK